MRTQKRTCLFAENGLNHALIIAHGNRLAITKEGKTADTNFIACSLGLCLTQPHRGNLRTAIGTARHSIIRDRMYILATSDFFHTDNAFMAGFMGKPWRACHITNRIEAGLCRGAIAICHNMTSVQLDFGLLQPKPL